MKVRMYMDLWRGIDRGTLSATTSPGAPMRGATRVAFDVEIADAVWDAVAGAECVAANLPKAQLIGGEEEGGK